MQKNFPQEKRKSLSSTNKNLRSFIRELSIHFGATVLHGKSFIPPKPLLSFSDKCNFRCQMCWIHSPYAKNSNNFEKILFSENPPKILEWEDFLKIADSLAEIKVPFVYVCGKGEPLLNPNALSMLYYLKQKKLNFSLTTNGSLLEPEILKTGLSYINISLDSVDEENYLRIHGIKSPRLAKIISNITCIREIRSRENYPTRIGVSFVISKLNIDELPKIAYLSQEFADYITFMNGAVYEEITHLALSRKDYFKLREYTSQIKDILKIPNNWEEFLHKVERATSVPDPRFQLKDYFSKFPCKVPYSFCLIYADGRITPCCPSAYVAGNAFQTSFKKVWNGKRFKDFRYNAYNLPKLKKELPLSSCYCCEHF